MRRVVLDVLLGLICASIFACNGERGSEPVAAKKTEMTMHTPSSDPVSKSPVAEAIKRKKLPDFPQKTVGEAFDGYSKAASKEWQETAVNGNKYFVDYIAWYKPAAVPKTLQKEGVVKVGVAVKFTVQNSGDFYVTMVSRVLMKSDNKTIAEPLDPAQAKAALSAIYDNTEFSIK